VFEPHNIDATQWLSTNSKKRHSHNRELMKPEVRLSYRRRTGRKPPEMKRNVVCTDSQTRQSNESKKSNDRSIDRSIECGSKRAICSNVLYKFDIIAKNWKLDLNRNLLNKFWQSFNFEFDTTRICSHIANRISGGRLSNCPWPPDFYIRPPSS